MDGVGVAEASGVADGAGLAVASLGFGVAFAGGSLAGGGDAGGALGAVEGLAAGVRDGTGDSKAWWPTPRSGVGLGSGDAGALGLRVEGDDGEEPGSTRAVAG